MLACPSSVVKLFFHHMGSPCSGDLSQFELDKCYLRILTGKTLSSCHYSDHASIVFSAGILSQVTSEVSDESKELEMYPANASG